MERLLAEPAERGPAAHHSTGRLTAAQAGIVDRWRARLLEDRPLPGRPRVSEMMRLLGMDDRPPASGSDAIAAAVQDLLETSRPAGLEMARYAEATRLAAARGGPAAPICQPVSFYLPEDLAAAAEQLRAQAPGEVIAAHNELQREAEKQFPSDEKQQALWVSAQLTRRGIPHRVRQVPRGAIARIAIDRWARRSADRVAADAVAYAAAVHDQAHRARRDMSQLQR
jgi:hypothetical protein